MAKDLFPRWDIDRIEICARIERVRSPLKIVLKTKNDPFFIERWINHHMNIVGPENLIIFDNMSDDPEVLSIYCRFRSQVEIARFTGPWFFMHHTYLFRDFYRSLANSSDYFVFIDTDEYLVMFGNDVCYADARIVSFVEENRRYDLFPTTWLFNANWSSTQFGCGPRDYDLATNLACGKPLIRSDKIPDGYVNHNFQLSTKIFAPPFRTDLFLLHLSRLYPRQRIAANVNKLIAAGATRQGENLESIMRRDDITDQVLAGYVTEIRDCLAAEASLNERNTALGPGCLELSEAGCIKYYSEAERKLIGDFIAEPRPVYELIPGQYRLDAVIAATFRDQSNRAALQV